MRKGGYKIVDFKGAELTNTVVVRPGIYSQIIDDYDKSILVSGVSLSGSLMDDAYASVSEVTGDSGDSVELVVYGGIITVTEDDEVSFAPATTPEELTEKIGDLDDLETTDKDSVVDAINEIISKAGGNEEFTATKWDDVQTSFVVKGLYNPLTKHVHISFAVHCSSDLNTQGIAVGIPEKYLPSVAKSGCVTVYSSGLTNPVSGSCRIDPTDGRLYQGVTQPYTDAFGSIDYSL